jgi:hypothetical protein
MGVVGPGHAFPQGAADQPIRQGGATLQSSIPLELELLGSCRLLNRTGLEPVSATQRLLMSGRWRLNTDRSAEAKLEVLVLNVKSWTT